MTARLTPARRAGSLLVGVGGSNENESGPKRPKFDMPRSHKIEGRASEDGGRIMAELNKVLLIGRLTRDPELRYTPGGMAVADFRLAVNHTYRAKDEKREEVCYIDINVLGRSAEVVKEYLAKGREVFIEGRLQLNTWETQEGEKRQKYRVVADRFQFLGGGRGGAERSSGGYENSAANDTYPEPASGPAEDDDLPF